MIRPIWTGLIVAGYVFLVVSCGGGSGSETTAAIEQEPSSEESTADQAVMHEDSELAKLMRHMHDQFKAARPYIESGEPIPDSLTFAYESIYTADRTDQSAWSTQFEGMAKLFLQQSESLRTDASIETFNAGVNACLSCHQYYCPGPVSKIKKLRL